jgi:hypothetical protein
VSSGVERAKGVKDAALIRRFCEAVREADARIADAIFLTRIPMHTTSADAAGTSAPMAAALSPRPGPRARRAAKPPTPATGTIPSSSPSSSTSSRTSSAGPSPVYHAARLSREIGGAQIHLKREDLNHTGAHKINNTIGQALLARRYGQAARHRRDRRRPARRGHGDDLRPLRPGMRGLHGQRGRQAAKPPTSSA